MWQKLHILFYKESTGSLIFYSLMIQSNFVLYFTIYIPFLLSNCSNKNEKQAGAELGKARNKPNRASHSRYWAYLFSSAQRLEFGSIKISVKPIHTDILLWSALFHSLTSLLLEFPNID